MSAYTDLIEKLRAHGSFVPDVDESEIEKLPDEAFDFDVLRDTVLVMVPMRLVLVAELPEFPGAWCLDQNQRTILLVEQNVLSRSAI